MIEQTRNRHTQKLKSKQTNNKHIIEISNKNSLQL